MLSEKNTTQGRFAHSITLLYKVHWVGETELYCLEIYCLKMVLKFKKNYWNKGKDISVLSEEGRKVRFLGEQIGDF